MKPIPNLSFQEIASKLRLPVTFGLRPSAIPELKRYPIGQKGENHAGKPQNGGGEIQKHQKNSARNHGGRVAISGQECDRLDRYKCGGIECHFMRKRPER
jgi:hypothetical protein